MTSERLPPGTSPSDASRLTAEHAPLASEVLHRGLLVEQFRVVGPLGRGGMGVVYEAEDTLLRRRVALKFLPRANDRSVGKLLHEARAIARLEHPNVVGIHHIGRWQSGYYLVLELMTGGDLQGQIRDHSPLSWPEATRAAADACRGLAAAHAAGFLHRDVKPSNLLRDASGTVKLADFGLVRGGDLTATAGGHLAGTAAYMSPEQCRGEPADERSDLYGLGATYFAMLTGRPPFSGESAVQVMFAHCSAPVPDPRTCNPDLPAGPADIVRKAMAKEPADRYQSAEEMLAALLALAAPATSEWSLPRPTPSASRLSHLPRRRAPAVLLSLAVLGAGVGIALVTWGSLDAERAAPTRTGMGQNGPTVATPFDVAGPPENRMSQLRGVVRSVSFSRDGQLIAAAAAEPLPGTGVRPGAVVWDRKTGAVVAHLWEGREVWAVAFVHHARLLSLCGQEGAVHWDLNMQAETVSTLGYGGIRASATAPDGSLGAIGFLDGPCQGQITEWHQPSGRTARMLGVGKGWPPVHELVYACDRTLAAAYGDGEVRIWLQDAADQPSTTLKTFTSKPAVLAFAPQQPVLAVAAGSRVTFWAPEGAWSKLSIATHGEVNATLFTADGEHLVTAGPGRDVVIWSLSRGEAVHTFRGHRGAVLTLALTPDGKVLASGDDVGEVRLWDMPDGLARAREGQ